MRAIRFSCPRSNTPRDHSPHRHQSTSPWITDRQPDAAEICRSPDQTEKPRHGWSPANRRSPAPAAGHDLRRMAVGAPFPNSIWVWMATRRRAKLQLQLESN